MVSKDPNQVPYQLGHTRNYCAFAGSGEFYHKSGKVAREKCGCVVAEKLPLVMRRRMGYNEKNGPGGIKMKRGRAWLLLAALAVLMLGCHTTDGGKVHQRTYTGVFDTVLYVSRYTTDGTSFQGEADRVYEKLTEYHRLFDIYNNYDGLNNLKTVNDRAGEAPVEVDGRLIELLLDCREYYEATGGRVNVAMGSVLAIWHNVRSQNINAPDKAFLPDSAMLEEAAKHCGWDTIVIDEENKTVFITDPAQSLDVGAIAKGWAVQKVADEAAEGLLISLGGNVCATGPKNEAGDSWTIGIQDPDLAGAYLRKVGLTQGSAVTSGDYQRFFMLDGKRYHHIIAPDTRMPAELWRSVTVLCADSGVADMLSTALFLMDRAQGMALLEMYNAEAMWLDGAGNCYYSAGFEARLKK